MTDTLTGVWDGTYTQPGVGIVTFLATLIESGGALGGSVTEPCATAGCPLSTHNASIAGHRSGSVVSFVKRYEPPGYGYDTVTYEGTVNAEATEIDGRWRLPGISGTFLMVRSTAPGESIATEEQSKPRRGEVGLRSNPGEGLQPSRWTLTPHPICCANRPLPMGEVDDAAPVNLTSSCSGIPFILVSDSIHHRLPDQLRAGLRLVFVGTAASTRSATVGHYYAHPGNRFWRALHEAGITPRRHEPSEFASLLDLGIGFTDLSKSGAGMDHQIARQSFDVAGFKAKIQTCHPRTIAFTSKKAASLFYNKPTSALSLGRQQTMDGFPDVFVLPSPSGAASGHWTLKPWHELAEWIKRT